MFCKGKATYKIIAVAFRFSFDFISWIYKFSFTQTFKAGRNLRFASIATKVNLLTSSSQCDLGRLLRRPVKIVKHNASIYL